MGFNKRIIDENLVSKYIESKKSLSLLFKADALIFSDKISSEVYELFCEGLKEQEIKIIFQNKKTKP